MSEVVRGWVLGIVGAAVLTSISLTLTPSGRVKKIVTLVCGLAMIIALVKPIAGLDYTEFSKNIQALRLDASEFSDSALESNEKLTRLIIEQECSAYILDKGALLGIDDLEVNVTLTWSEEGFWYPSGAELRTGAPEEKRNELSFMIESALGIKAEALTWRAYDEE